MTTSKQLASILSFLITAVLAHGQALLPIEMTPGGPQYLPGEILIQFKASVSDAQMIDAFGKAKLNLVKHVQTPAMREHGHIGLTQTRTALPVPAALIVLNNLPGVEFAEPNWVAQHDSESNDPLYLDGSLWGMFGDDLPSPIGPPSTFNSFGSQAEKAWAAGFTGSPDVFIGVIDQGIQFDHPDLAANVWTNPGEVPGNGIDDDGNGYVDDVHGWNAVGDNGYLLDPPNDHGTHIAGTVGAVGGNGIGVAGVNWNVTLIAGKCASPSGFYYLDVIQALDYMTTLKTKKGLNIVALNNSWSGPAFSQALLDAYTRAAQAGILSICSASNQGANNDVSPRYPTGLDTTPGAGYNAVISVAAIDKNGTRATFSNYGQTTVDLGAPGVDIISTVPVGAYSPGSGTSMATPHVTGAVALYASTHPAASALQIRNELLTSGVRPLPSLAGITVTGGMLDIGTLVTGFGEALPALFEPANLQAAAVLGRRVNLSWSDQSGNELGFAIERSTDGVNYLLADTVGANLAACSDRTVLPSTTYYYRLRAYHAGGNSTYIYAPSSITTPQLTPPTAPSNLTAASPTKATVNLTWADKSNNEEAFQLERKTGSTGTWQVIATPAANTVKFTNSGLVSRTTYVYRIRAFNADGASAWSNEVSIRAK